MKDADRHADSTRVQAQVYISATENVQLNLNDRRGRRRESRCVPAEGAATIRTSKPRQEDAASQKIEGKEIVIILTQLSEVCGCSSSSSVS